MNQCLLSVPLKKPSNEFVVEKSANASTLVKAKCGRASFLQYPGSLVFVYRSAMNTDQFLDPKNSFAIVKLSVQKARTTRPAQISGYSCDGWQETYVSIQAAYGLTAFPKRRGSKHAGKR